MTKRPQILRTLLRDYRGTAAVEMALLSPVLVLLFFGTLEVTQLIRVEAKLTHAAQTIQDIVAGQAQATTASLQIAFNGGQLVMTPFTAANMTAAIASVSFGSNATPTQVTWQQVENGDPGMSSSFACSAASGMSLSNDSVIVVQVTYSYNPIISYLFGKHFTLSQMAFGRPRNTSVISNSSSSNGATNC